MNTKLFIRVSLFLYCPACLLGCVTPLCDSLTKGADRILAVHAPAPRAQWRAASQPIETGWTIGNGLSDTAMQARNCERLEQSLWLKYRRFDFPSVREASEELAHAEGATARQRATAYLLAGCAACVEGKEPEARQAFIKTIAEDPGVTPDEKLFPSYVCALYWETFEGVSKGVR